MLALMLVWLWAGTPPRLLWRRRRGAAARTVSCTLEDSAVGYACPPAAPGSAHRSTTTAAAGANAFRLPSLLFRAGRAAADDDLPDEDYSLDDMDVDTSPEAAPARPLIVKRGASDPTGAAAAAAAVAAAVAAVSAAASAAVDGAPATPYRPPDQAAASTLRLLALQVRIIWGRRRRPVGLQWRAAGAALVRYPPAAHATPYSLVLIMAQLLCYCAITRAPPAVNP